MSSITQAQLIAMQMRLNRKVDDAAPADAVAHEGDLHEFILQYCRDHGFIALHGSMAHRTHRTEGEPDFVILADYGKAMLIECKSKTGKLRPGQVAFRAWAEKLGHVVLVIRSKREFLALF